MTKVAFVSFRLKAHDGVSVAAEQWMRVLGRWGFDVHRVAGYIPDPEESDFLIPELNHQDPLVESFTTKAFGGGCDRHELRGELALLSEAVERGLLPAMGAIAPDLVVAENVFSLPLNIPLAMVLNRFLAEENISCIAVHHDFYWEDSRFSECVMDDLLTSHFPPLLSKCTHVIVNDHAKEELHRRTGISATRIRNSIPPISLEERLEELVASVVAR